MPDESSTSQPEHQTTDRVAPAPELDLRFDGSPSASSLRRTAPVLHIEEDEPSTHTLTVLIPARNEAHNLPGCLDSLVRQSEPGFVLGEQWHILVIDDNSSDETSQIIATFADKCNGIMALSAPSLKSATRGLTGKNAALWFGASQPLAHTAKWLLFTDADTLHEPGSTSRAIVEAERHELAMLSYSPRQLVANFAQRALMPLIFSELASTYPPKKVSDPSNPIAAANGQFLLVRRQAYFDVGGHMAVGSSVLEDVALARLLKRRHPIRLRYAPEAVSARMYASTPEMIEGWTKNLALLFGNPLMMAAIALLNFVLLLGLPLLPLLMPNLVVWQALAVFIVWLRVLLRYFSRVGQSHAPFLDRILTVMALPLFAALLFRSWQNVKIAKAVTWKGREYTT
ncbi:glycosyltransferase [Terriglobus roseus]|uniref:Glycosyltransferase, catalytic subunit of cellulose synthase and poly-beta-1,6-N-acetylglucosamine synthase n=1 Tax=Terriglobus roseus TaxID=392734 RepID=A0A1H4JC15_9BACT|nr:glycosyltransferase [Terriglobus roseus]SEB43864.1 Glycosyltransferase, catalytic subunit of cellulose synthase and poly-beta-1,6-N-acetylglucosamine synthase [Terriglobus roseus]